MSQTNCACSVPSVAIPVTGLTLNLSQEALDGAVGPAGNGELRTWESEWFSSVSGGGNSFEHNLNLEEPWRCLARLVARVKTPASGWQPDEIIFGDGSNYMGKTASTEIGWVITLTTNTISVGFGNHGAFLETGKNGGAVDLLRPNVECKLLISY